MACFVSGFGVLLLALFSISSTSPNTIVLLTSAAKTVVNESISTKSLHFQGSSFKIAMFADLHFGEAESEDWGPEQDFKSQRVMSYVLDTESPDFVIFLGDVLTANNMASPNATAYWDQAIEPTAQRKIPWSSVFGNHDDMPFEWPIDWFNSSGIPGLDKINGYFRGTTRVELMDHDMSWKPLSMSSSSSKSLWPSVSNYAIKILSQKQNALVAILYFLDSGGGSYPELISSIQVDWFKNLSNELNPNQSIPELAFWHIPTHEYANIAPTPRYAIQSPCIGTINLESVDPQVSEFGFIDVISSRASMKATFVGHNHGLDWCCPLHGNHVQDNQHQLPFQANPYLCFARHTGYGGYGTWTKGARIVEMVDEPFQITTYIRLENGSTVGWLNLSSTMTS